MRIHSFSKVLVLPLVFLVFLVYYLSEYVDRTYSIYIVVPVVLAVVLYIFHGNIDYWYLQRNPYGLDEKLQNWVNRYFIPFQKLNKSEQDIFEHRLELYMNARLIQAMGSELKDVPEDIKAMIACHAIWMTLNMEDYLIGDFDRIYTYKHHFPSPAYPQLHGVETNIEDGVILLNSSLLAQAILHPGQFYNIAVHAYAEAILNVRGPIQSLEMHDDLEKVSSWKYDEILRQTGLEYVKPVVLHIHHFFVFPDEYRQYFPEQTIFLETYFNRENH